MQAYNNYEAKDEEHYAKQRGTS